MKKYFSLFFLNRSALLILFFTLSCSDLSDRKNDKSLVGVYGIIRPFTPHQEVRLIRAFNMDQSWNDIIDSLNTVESGALVTLRLDTIEARLTEIKPGLYRDTAGIIPYRRNSIYHLRVQTLFKEIIEAETRVPDTAQWIMPANMDTFRVTIYADTTRNELRHQENPSRWEWSSATGAGAYYCLLRGDSIITQHSIHGTIFRPSVVLFSNKRPLVKTYFTLFDGTDPKEGEQWIWRESIEMQNQTVRYPLFVQINTYSFKITDDRRAVILSNVRNGFGYFAAMNVSRKPLYAIVKTIIEN